MHGDVDGTEEGEQSYHGVSFLTYDGSFNLAFGSHNIKNLRCCLGETWKS